MTQSVLHVDHLSKRYPGSFSWKKWKRNPDSIAVKDISFTINPGEIVGLLGPNGAGKTTTIQMLLGTTQKTSGSITYFGQDFEQHRSAVLERMNYASAYTKFPNELTVRENLIVYGMLYHVPNIEDRIKKLLDQFGMMDYIHSPIRALSAGQTTRVILAKAFINYPELILLDEPTASLDPESAANVREFLLKQQKKYNVTMLFTSHNMAEVTEVCDRVLFIQKGRLVAEDTPAGLARQIKDVMIRVTIDGKEEVIKCKEEEISLALESMAKRGVQYTQISIDKPTLEDYFVKMSRETK
jgi:ABC-2 type transport system ATP-binding protein